MCAWRSTRFGTRSADDGGDLSEYELLRLEHIRRNHEHMVKLGLEDDTFEATSPKKKRSRRAVKREPRPTRQSTRTRGAKPEYTGN